ncbi:MAG: MnhB domain-containing protein [Alkalispirochaetaceae bacterium]
MKRTQLLDVIARKLAPFVMLFGFYLIAFAYRSPGGGFQGGVVIASGVILLALGREIWDVERLFPIEALHIAEILAFAAILLVSLGGIVVGGSVLAYPEGSGEAARRFLFVLNLFIGLKVGAGVTLLSLTLFDEDQRWR